MRAHANLLENLPHFAVLVLVSHLAGVSGMRTLAYASGVAGELLVASQLFGLG